MSRKTNNLKKRLRIVQAQLDKRARKNSPAMLNLCAALNKMERERDEAIKKQKFDEGVRSLVVSVERDIASQYADRYMASIAFQPDRFLRASWRDRYPVNVDGDILHMAHDISRQIKKQIRQCLTEAAGRSGAICARG